MELELNKDEGTYGLQLSQISKKVKSATCKVKNGFFNLPKQM